MENDWKKRLGMVYSTDPDYEFESGQEQEPETPAPDQQKLYVELDRKNRKGKTVTLVTGFAGAESDLKLLAKDLKNKCGVGGSAKAGEILIQGNFRDRIITLLSEQGYNVKQKGG